MAQPSNSNKGKEKTIQTSPTDCFGKRRNREKRPNQHLSVMHTKHLPRQQ